ncbi:MAG: hypothetical protein M0C28_19345 [Candidatus Moduliflexus flocculans]|nr:hypothetical protein [Candidatus Moduliflexus flocculans]
MTVGSQVYRRSVCLRGEKRFSFMWELVLQHLGRARSICSPRTHDAEHAAFFSAQATPVCASPWFACVSAPRLRHSDGRPGGRARPTTCAQRARGRADVRPRDPGAARQRHGRPPAAPAMRRRASRSFVPPRARVPSPARGEGLKGPGGLC